MSEWTIDRYIQAKEMRAHDALVIIGDFLTGEVKSLTPVDTGLLRSSITYVVDGLKVDIGTNVEYALAVELGIEQKKQSYLDLALKLNDQKIRKFFNRVMMK